MFSANAWDTSIIEAFGEVVSRNMSSSVRTLAPFILSLMRSEVIRNKVLPRNARISLKCFVSSSSDQSSYRNQYMLR
jgi:hypothetical protein